MEFFPHFEFKKYRELLVALPSVIVFVTLAVLLMMVVVNPGKIEGRYRAGAHQAVEDRNFELAKVYFGRVLKDDPQQQPADWLAYAKVLGATGDSATARSILGQLAPNDKPGFGPAHEITALQIASGLKQSRDPEVLEKLHHHLTYCRNSRSIDVMKAWSLYYISIGEPEKAMEKFDAAAAQDPELLPMVSLLHGQMGNESQKKKLAESSVEYLTQKLDKDPLDHATRIQLAQMMITLERDAEAGQLLSAGMALKNDRVIKRALAEYSVYRYVKAIKDDMDFATRLGLLSRALTFDPMYQPTYDHLVTLYQRYGTDEDRATVKQTLQETIVSGQGVPLAHFALSNLYAIEDEMEEAQWHAEKAYKLDPKLTVVANNLAWLLAHDNPPDLNRAVQLASEIVKENPSQVRFRDTLGTVLMKRGEYDAAIVELERALPGFPDKVAIHKKLAVLYQQIGKQTLAELHAERAGVPLQDLEPLGEEGEEQPSAAVESKEKEEATDEVVPAEEEEPKVEKQSTNELEPKEGEGSASDGEEGS